MKSESITYKKVIGKVKINRKETNTHKNMWNKVNCIDHFENLSGGLLGKLLKLSLICGGLYKSKQHDSLGNMLQDLNFWNYRISC